MNILDKPIMVDSAVYITYFRNSRDIRQDLMPYLASGMLYNCGIIRAEVIRGFKNHQLKNSMTDFFNIIPEVPTNARLWQQIAEMAWTIDRTIGGSVPLTDVVIARSAMLVDAALISPDQHFLSVTGLDLRSEF